jgi:transposase
MPQSNSNRKVEVRLSPAEREELVALCRKGTVGAAKLRHAQILLMADEDRREGRRPDWYIAEKVGLSERQICRVRQKFVREGLNTALERQPRITPGTPPKFDGRQEAQLVRLCCSTPPAGRSRWTLRLLADELGRLQVVASVCPETVRRCLKKIASSRGGRSGSASRRKTRRDLWPKWNDSSTSTARNSTSSTR